MIAVGLWAVIALVFHNPYLDGWAAAGNYGEQSVMGNVVGFLRYGVGFIPTLFLLLCVIRWGASDLIGLYHEQMSFGAEIVELSSLFFKEELEYTEEANEVLAGEMVPAVMAEFKNQLEALETFDAASIKSAIKAVQKETGAKGKNLFMPIRVVTTGQTHGPELADAISLIGKEKVIARVGKFAN